MKPKKRKPTPRITFEQMKKLCDGKRPGTGACMDERYDDQPCKKWDNCPRFADLIAADR